MDDPHPMDVIRLIHGYFTPSMDERITFVGAFHIRSRRGGRVHQPEKKIYGIVDQFHWIATPDFGGLKFFFFFFFLNSSLISTLSYRS